MTQKPGAIQAAGKEEAMAHLAAIVDSSNDAIISKTQDGIITSWNQAAEKLYGYSAEEAVGHNIHMLVPKDRLEELHQITEKVLRGERIRNLQTVRIAKGGREVEVSLTLSRRPVRVVEKYMNGSLTACNTEQGARFRIEV